MQKPNIYDYFDYLHFLKDVYAYKKDQNPSFSLGVWARILDIKAKSFLSMVLNGKKVPSEILTRKIAENFGMSEIEADHFWNLVQFRKINCSDKLKKRALSFLRKNEAAQRETKIISDELFALISHWSYFLLGSLCQRPDFENDPDWIQTALRANLSKGKISEVLNTLISLGLISKKEDGRFVQTDRNISTQDGVPSPIIEKYHLEMLELSQTLVKKSNVDERYLSSVIFPVKKSEIEKMKDGIKCCENEFLDNFMASPSDSDPIYALNIQLLPLTK